MADAVDLKNLADQGWGVIVELGQAVVDDKLELRLGHSSDGEDVIIACANGHALAILLIDRPEEGRAPEGVTLQ